MKKKLTFTLLGLIINMTTWCQVSVTGTVISNDDKNPLPGISIVEKGTTNGTVTQADGRFSINVMNDKSTLVFYFVGFITREEVVNGRDNINVTLKVDCISDWFDVQKIGLYFVSGIINNPVGGKLEIAFPAYFGQGTLTSSISYQADVAKNRFVNGDLKLKHFINNCDFNMDAAWYYREFEFGDFSSTANSIEINSNLNKVGIITGFSHLNFRPIEMMNSRGYNGPIIGLRTWINGKLRFSISGKAAIYKDKLEYFGEILRESKDIDLFVKCYKLDSFYEVSIGVGKTFNYRFRKQKG